MLLCHQHVYAVTKVRSEHLRSLFQDFICCLTCAKYACEIISKQLSGIQSTQKFTWVYFSVSCIHWETRVTFTSITCCNRCIFEGVYMLLIHGSFLTKVTLVLTMFLKEQTDLVAALTCGRISSTQTDILSHWFSSASHASSHSLQIASTSVYSPITSNWSNKNPKWRACSINSRDQWKMEHQSDECEMIILITINQFWELS